jgi:hypothetical protein
MVTYTNKAKLECYITEAESRNSAGVKIVMPVSNLVQCVNRCSELASAGQTGCPHRPPAEVDSQASWTGCCHVSNDRHCFNYDSC